MMGLHFTLTYVKLLHFAISKLLKCPHRQRRIPVQKILHITISVFDISNNIGFSTNRKSSPVQVTSLGSSETQKGKDMQYVEKALPEF